MSEFRAAYDLLRAEGDLWALDPRAFDGMVARLAHQAASGAAATSKRPTAPAQNVAIVPIVGPLLKRGNFLTEMLGYASYDRIRASLAQAVVDRSVDKIVMYIDSPGGVVTGCEETAAAVVSARRTKPVVAYCDGLVASAAYWIGSQADSITITPSGAAGSIGVISLHMDFSEAMKQAGVKPTFLTSKVSPRKADLNPYQPLDSEARKRAQADIDTMAKNFVATVARGREVPASVVAERFGQGDCLLADAAKAAGMVDRIGSIEDAVSASAPTAAGKASAAYLSIIAEAASSNPLPGDRYRQILERGTSLMRDNRAMAAAYRALIRIHADETMRPRAKAAALAEAQNRLKACLPKSRLEKVAR
ncbi:signal peptide peptidase SppA [Bradyrhizobium ottawaense]|uniref:S49 family peptidase n=1 Tax=Bradyrhizobium ottawaense TaxID=931866 RepID=UPI00383728E7